MTLGNYRDPESMSEHRIAERIVRFSIGLEDINKLIEAIKVALEVFGKSLVSCDVIVPRAREQVIYEKLRSQIVEA